MSECKKTAFDEFMIVLEMQAAQMGVSMSELPRTPEEIYQLEQMGYVVDMETGDIVAMDTDRVALTVIGEAVAVANKAGASLL